MPETAEVTMEEASERARARLTQLIDRLSSATDSAEIRDLSIGVAALASSLDEIDEQTKYERVHVAVLERWRDNIAAILEPLTGRSTEDLRYGSYRFNQGPIIVDRGEGDPGRISERAFWDLLEGTYSEIRDRVANL